MSLSTLDRRLSAVSARLLTGVARIGSNVIDEIADRLVPATPVLTGFARGNWRPSINAPATLPVTVLDPTGQATIARIKVIGTRFRVGDTFFLVNRAPYINRLANGSSPQASAGWIERAVAEGMAAGVARAQFGGIL